MNRPYVTRYSHALRKVLGERCLVALGRATGHCQRLRTVTPQRLVCALMEALGAHRVRTIADILRTFNAQSGLAVQYKAFHNRLAQPEFAVFMHEVYQAILRDLSQKVLRAAPSVVKMPPVESPRSVRLTQYLLSDPRIQLILPMHRSLLGLIDPVLMFGSGFSGGTDRP